MTDIPLLLQTKDHIQSTRLAEVRNVQTIIQYDNQKVQQKARIDGFTTIATQEAIHVSTNLYLNNTSRIGEVNPTFINKFMTIAA